MTETAIEGVEAQTEGQVAAANDAGLAAAPDGPPEADPDRAFEARCNALMAMNKYEMAQRIAHLEQFEPKEAP